MLPSGLGIPKLQLQRLSPPLNPAVNSARSDSSSRRSDLSDRSSSQRSSQLSRRQDHTKQPGACNATFCESFGPTKLMSERMTDDVERLESIFQLPDAESDLEKDTFDSIDDDFHVGGKAFVKIVQRDAKHGNCSDISDDNCDRASMIAEDSKIPTLPIQGKQALFSEGQEAKDPSVKGGPISLGFSLNLGNVRPVQEDIVMKRRVSNENTLESSRSAADEFWPSKPGNNTERSIFSEDFSESEMDTERSFMDQAPISSSHVPSANSLNSEVLEEGTSQAGSSSSRSLASDTDSDISSEASSIIESPATKIQQTPSMPFEDPMKATRSGGLGLDLKSLAQEEPEEEGRDKRLKLAYFDQHFSEVHPNIFVVGETLAKNEAALQAQGITHIVNCIGMILNPMFPDSFSYLTLHLLDAASEDIASLLYLVFNFMQRAINSGGKICIHCSQGVSRSVALAIAFIMWKTGDDYEKTFQAVKAIRGVANPNLGFACQLMRWGRLQNTQSSNVRAFNITSHSQNPDFPSRLVAREVREPLKRDMMRDDNVMIIRTPEQSFMWKGKSCRLSHYYAGRRCHADMVRYEKAERVLQQIYNIEDLPPVLQAAFPEEINKVSPSLQLQIA